MSTLVRLLTTAFPQSRIVDAGRYAGGRIDVLVTSNTVTSAMHVGAALNEARRFHRPILVQMNTQPGFVKNAESHLKPARPNAFAEFQMTYRRAWVVMAAAPGQEPPKGRDVTTLLTGLSNAIPAMRAQPEYLALFRRQAAMPPLVPAHAAGISAIPPHVPSVGGLARTSLSRAGPQGTGVPPGVARR